MKTVKIIIDGDVQGVGYRSWFRREAEAFHVRGYVKNRDDGSVEAVISGEEHAVEQLLGIAKQGPDTGLVRSVSVISDSMPAIYTDFRVLY